MKADTAEPAVYPFTVTVAVDASYGDPERFRHDAEQILAFALALLANDTRAAEIKRRMRGYEPREMWEAQP